MNNRIKELEPQCWEHNEFGLNFNYQKFAELIVRECALVAKTLPHTPERHWVTDSVTYIPVHCEQNILKHFGVEDNSIKVGSRIKVVSKFNVGARGTVNYIEPSGKLWVRRDGASSDVSYYPTEVIGVEL